MSITRRIAFLFTLLALGLASPTARAEAPRSPETVLRLFDLELQTVSRDQLRAAIRKAGGKATSSTPSVDNFAVERIGLPGLTTLEVVFRGDDFVLAAYHSARSHAPGDEKLRKMLVEKYGLPAGAGKNFTDPYGGSGKSTWTFANGMRVVYNRDFFGTVDLTYVDQARFDAVKKEATDADREDTRNQTRAKSNAF
ncbi:MAG TPA: hypothetical protein VHU40_09790 [Polyangia bacterium]|jgi:hypothetical protein|nr:hypothetical protein [Polyangia bacterium]